MWCLSNALIREIFCFSVVIQCCIFLVTWNMAAIQKLGRTSIKDALTPLPGDSRCSTIIVCLQPFRFQNEEVITDVLDIIIFVYW